MKLLTGLFLAAGISLRTALAQVVTPAEKPIPSSQVIVKLSLPHLMVNGLHLDVEIPVGRQRLNSITLSPHGYKGSLQNLNNIVKRPDHEEEVSGLGAEVIGKHYFVQDSTVLSGFYAGIGLNYHRFSISWQDLMLVKTPHNGLLYYDYMQVTRHEKINRMGACFLFGLQQRLMGKRLTGDLFGGLGYYNSDHTPDAGEKPRFNKGHFDIGISGVYFPIGFKLGYALGGSR